MAYVRDFRYFCTMIELAQHIEALLLENDCVIVPGLGGFVAHYSSARRVKEENIFLPPTRIIGFNPQLKMNDGLLVQSYMSVYGTSFSDATKMVESKVSELITTLHEDGKANLPNVGEVHFTIHNTFDFVPYDNKITTPYLYGLDAFQMQELSALPKAQPGKIIMMPAPAAAKPKKYIPFKFNRSYLTGAAAVVAAIILSFFFSAPIENTEVMEENYATLLPGELFEKIEKQSLAITPIVLKQNNPTRKPADKKNNFKNKRVVTPVAVREVKVSKAPATNAETKKETAKPAATASAPKQKTEPAATAPVVSAPVVSAPNRPYHIIIASVGTEKDAEAMAAELKAKGFPAAKAIIGDGKMRVSIESCGTEVEAYKALARIRENETYKNAWVLKK